MSRFSRTLVVSVGRAMTALARRATIAVKAFILKMNGRNIRTGVLLSKVTEDGMRQ